LGSLGFGLFGISGIELYEGGRVMEDVFKLCVALGLVVFFLVSSFGMVFLGGFLVASGQVPLGALLALIGLTWGLLR
jgi:hypothetical protein